MSEPRTSVNVTAHCTYVPSVQRLDKSALRILGQPSVLQSNDQTQSTVRAKEKPLCGSVDNKFNDRSYWKDENFI
jgi:hypothetical protein